eukprot:8967132-Pyramimonas_sp.AAC.1
MRGGKRGQTNVEEYTPHWHWGDPEVPPEVSRAGDGGVSMPAATLARPHRTRRRRSGSCRRP